ncbi:hypothetical protein DBY68_016840 [Pseudocitrobacter sp. RIT415]|uniref:hypothetical protein n=1 Tax=Pseudocitrobacter sp. RIT415 TaxID=2202163 RepID=UPI000D363229|nr:hypothetical protein [Pseudocitrobacter sp. RIT 415]RAU45282.1 hypothetical protein DBY68_016840 [Pseudocitrobacter sp. RIT 415]
MATPRELLEEVKKRFLTLLVENQKDMLDALLRKALTEYQDRAGCIQSIRVKEGSSIPCPDDYLELVAVTDATGNYVSCDIFGGNIEISSDQRVSYPLRMDYLVHLSQLDLDKGTVPPVAVGIIKDYLEILIAIPNSELDRRVSIAGKLDASNIPDEAALVQRRTDLEAEMSTRGAIPQAMSVFSSWG